MNSAGGGVNGSVNGADSGVKGSVNGAGSGVNGSVNGVAGDGEWVAVETAGEGVKRAHHCGGGVGDSDDRAGAHDIPVRFRFFMAADYIRFACLNKCLVLGLHLVTAMYCRNLSRYQLSLATPKQGNIGFTIMIHRQGVWSNLIDRFGSDWKRPSGC